MWQERQVVTAPIVTLLSDFGMRGPYVAEMKASILTICRDAIIVDISHEIKKFDTRIGAFVLASASRYFPRGTIHLAVVDPGVGTKRRPILVETKRGFYVGPDNGLLTLAAQQDGIRSVVHITNKQLMLPYVSGTFHGRDIFAPAAAHLAIGRRPFEFGSEIDDYVDPKFAKPRFIGNKLRGQVLYIDDFGNIITNISSRDLEKAGSDKGKSLFITLRDKVHLLRFLTAYGEVKPNMPLALIGSHGFLEIAINQGNASKRFEARTEDKVVVSLAEEA